MNRKSLTVLAFIGWALFALSLFSHAPADQFKDGPPLTANCPGDIAPAGGDGVVNVNDLLAVINGWGPCPSGCQSAGDCNDGNPCTQDICMGGRCQHIQIANCCQGGGDCVLVPNATVGCQNNQCVITGCLAGYFDCNGIYSDGCEINVMNNPQHCGACNQPCVIPNAFAVCVNGFCAIGACNPGFADCNNIASDGCEVSIMNNVANCGQCGHMCMAANALVACVNGTCAIAGCLPGFLDCNNIFSDGCEVNKMTDSNNCGFCNNVCPVGFHCANGTCVPN